MSATPQHADPPTPHKSSARPLTTALWLTVIVALGAALRLYQLGAESYWLDENDTVRLAALPLINLLRSLATPDRAPLYYLLAHGWIRLVGNGEAAMRLLPALAGIAGIPLLFFVGRALLGEAVGLLAAALLAVSEFAIHQAQEARYYSFVLLFTLLAAWFAIRARDYGRTSDFLALTVASLLLVVTHYLALCWPSLSGSTYCDAARGHAARREQRDNGSLGKQRSSSYCCRCRSSPPAVSGAGNTARSTGSRHPSRGCRCAMRRPI